MENLTENPTEDPTGTSMENQTESGNGMEQHIETTTAGHIEEQGEQEEGAQEEEDENENENDEEDGDYDDEEEDQFVLCKIPSPSSTSGPDAVECSICLRNFPVASLTTLPCGHRFDNKCILVWTQVYDVLTFHDGHARCPMCRTWLLYRCGDVISHHHLRPGVTILPQELTLNCQSYITETDTHSQTSSNRPYNPQAYAEQQRLFEELLNQDDEEDLPEQEGPQGPANTDQSDNNADNDDEPPAQEMAQLALRVYLPERPKHHNFKFMTRVAREINPNQRAQTLDEYNLRKESIASALDDDRINFITMTIKGLHKDFDYFEAEFPQSSILVNQAVFEDLDMQLGRLMAMLEQFKRQHEGFIELSEVALEFRAQREDAMHEQLDSFWRLLNFVNGEIQKKYNTGMRGAF